MRTYSGGYGSVDGSASGHGTGAGLGYGHGSGDGSGSGHGPGDPVGHVGRYEATLSGMAWGGLLRIGCEVHLLDHWIAHADEIDAEYGDGIAGETRALAVALKSRVPVVPMDPTRGGPGRVGGRT